MTFFSCSLQKEPDTYTFSNISSYDLSIHFEDKNEIVSFPKDSKVYREALVSPSFKILHEEDQHIITDWKLHSTYITVRDVLIEPYTFTVKNLSRFTAEFVVELHGLFSSKRSVIVEPGKTEYLDINRIENEAWSFYAKSPASYRIKSQGFLSYEIELF